MVISQKCKLFIFLPSPEIGDIQSYLVEQFALSNVFWNRDCKWWVIWPFIPYYLPHLKFNRCITTIKYFQLKYQFWGKLPYSLWNLPSHFLISIVWKSLNILCFWCDPEFWAIGPTPSSRWDFNRAFMANTHTQTPSTHTHTHTLTSDDFPTLPLEPHPSHGT